jgi:hypothetical protein
MIPRRISQVPPRNIHDGACKTVSASTSSKRAMGPGQARCQQAHTFGNLALKGVAEILDARGFEIEGLTRLQHSGDRQRHAPHGP